MVFLRRFAWFASMIMGACLLHVSSASAMTTGKRLALVIGNDAYQNVTKLEKAGNDASAMARELRAAGFEVTLERDINFRNMVKRIEFFTSHVSGGDQVVVFYAGHGVQLRTGSYLLPVDIEANSESEVEKTSYALNDLMDKLSDAKAAFSLVMVDACRDNPLKSNGRSLGFLRGLLPPDPPKGQMVVYSASKGQQALDKLNFKDNNPNSVFTREFIARMKQPGVRIEDLVRDVQDAVEDLARTVGHDQRPAMYNEARGSFYFYGPTTVVASQTDAAPGPTPYVAPPKTAEQIEGDTWDSVKDSGDVASLEEYVKHYPKGRFVALARIAIAKAKSKAKRFNGAPDAAIPVLPAVNSTVAPTGADVETSLWQAVSTGNTADDYAVYIQQYPKGKYLPLARQRVQKLNDEAIAKAQADETASWQAADKAQTIEAYANYDKRYPNGQYRPLSQTRVQKLQSDLSLQQEEEAWRTAQKGGSKTVSSFLERFSGGSFAAEAAALLEKLKKEEAEIRPGKVFKDCATCPEMVILPAGGFMMGDGENPDEQPLHYVNINSFASGRYAVTKGQFAAFVRAKSYVTEAEKGDGCFNWNGAKFDKNRTYNWRNVGFDQAEDHPVVCVSWNDAKAYVQWLNQITGKNYRLLSEAEHEYAARAGSTGRFWWGNTASRDYANYGKDEGMGPYDGKFTTPGGKFPANPFGLYDISGNTWNWVEDYYHDNYIGAPSDGSAWVTGGEQKYRLFRGGSWYFNPSGLRSAFRNLYSPDFRGNSNGFRVARTIDTP